MRYYEIYKKAFQRLRGTLAYSWFYLDFSQTPEEKVALIIFAIDSWLHGLWNNYWETPFSSVQSLSHAWLFATPWTAAIQDSLSFIISCSLLKLMSIESVMSSNHLILCCPLLLLPSIFPSIRVFSNEWALHIRWPMYWSFSLSISHSNEHPWLLIEIGKSTNT